MELIDNITRLLGDDLKATLKPKAKLNIAASRFSMCAFEALKGEQEKIDELSQRPPDESVEFWFAGDLRKLPKANTEH
jgi:hypothetical protein